MARAIIIKEPKIVISIMLNAGNGETIGGMHQIIKYLENKYATSQRIYTSGAETVQQRD